LGLADSKSAVIGDDVYLFIGAKNPTEYDPSAVKTFTADDGSVTAVRTYRDEQDRSDILAVDYSEQVVVTSTLAIRRIAVK
jgi:hypothetical protein